MAKYAIILEAQEEGAPQARFGNEGERLVMTTNWESRIKEFIGTESNALISLVIAETMRMIKIRVGAYGGADYLQVAKLQIDGEQTLTFWVIDDGEAVTFLLPEDY